MTWHIHISFFCLPTSFLSFSNILSLWRFPIFIPLSRYTTTWLTKEKNTKSIFESVYQCINMCIYICIDHKRIVRGVTFFLLWLGRHTTVVTKSGRMKVNGSNHGMKGKPKTCGLTITTIRNNVHRFLSVVKTRTNQTRGRHNFFFLPRLNLSPWAFYQFIFYHQPLCVFPFFSLPPSPTASLSHSRLHEKMPALVDFVKKLIWTSYCLCLCSLHHLLSSDLMMTKKKGCFPVSRIYILVFHTLHRDTSWCDHCYQRKRKV